MRNIIRTALIITTLATPFAAFADAPAKPPTKATDVKDQGSKDKATPTPDKDKAAGAKDTKDTAKKVPPPTPPPAPKKAPGKGSADTTK